MTTNTDGAPKSEPTTDAQITGGATESKKRRKLPPYDPNADIIRPRHIQQATGVSQTTAWRERRAGRFPEPIRLTNGTKGWLRSDINDWLALRGRAPRAGKAAAASSETVPPCRDGAQSPAAA